MKKITFSALKIPLITALLFTAYSISYSFNLPFTCFGVIKNAHSRPVEYIFSISFGMRRLLADVSFIRLMQYYGTAEIHEGAKKHEHCDERGHCHHHYEGEPEFGKGDYPLFVQMTRDIIFLDPYFKEAVLYSAGSLAFNLNKPDDAVSVLNTALLFTPGDWHYVKLLGAIAQSRLRNKEKIAEFMYEIAMREDTPVMVKQIAAFLNKKAGRKLKAAEIYGNILKTTKDPFYLDNARRQLEALK
ncbi:MAG: hypothetical protein COT17_07840 [Elusimicrobia bacterium CG08_land_8_20_14_0_20_51_18]|nr:MAG: hypothetical protein COT17_07840 [Elusimicrobia bacterium CG08_land_8_20_14_0_20_51_18]